MMELEYTVYCNIQYSNRVYYNTVAGATVRLAELRAGYICIEETKEAQ